MTVDIDECVYEIEWSALGYFGVTKEVTGHIIGDGEFKGEFLSVDIVEKYEVLVEENSWIQMFSQKVWFSGESLAFGNDT